MITTNIACHQKWADAAYLLPGPCLRVGVLGGGRPWFWVRGRHGGRGCGQAGGAGGEGSRGGEDLISQITTGSVFEHLVELLLVQMGGGRGDAMIADWPALYLRVTRL